MNLTIITGNLGKDAISTQVNEKYVIQFTVATTEKYSDKEITDWHTCKYWVKSDKLTQHLVKGTKVAIQGKNKTDVYEKDGQKKYNHYILVEKLELLPKVLNSEKKETQEQESDSLPF